MAELPAMIEEIQAAFDKCCCALSCLSIPAPLLPIDPPKSSSRIDEAVFQRDRFSYAAREYSAAATKVEELRSRYSEEDIEQVDAFAVRRRLYDPVAKFDHHMSATSAAWTVLFNAFDGRFRILPAIGRVFGKASHECCNMEFLQDAAGMLSNLEPGEAYSLADGIEEEMRVMSSFCEFWFDRFPARRPEITWGLKTELIAAKCESVHPGATGNKKRRKRRTDAPTPEFKRMVVRLHKKHGGPTKARKELHQDYKHMFPPSKRNKSGYPSESLIRRWLKERAPDHPAT